MRAWTRRLSLRLRLLAVVAGLLVAALVLAFGLTVTTLRAQLIRQVDDQLRLAATDINRVLDERRGPGDDGHEGFGSRYVAQAWFDNGVVIGPISEGPTKALPDFPMVSADQAREHGNEILTLDGHGGHWRAIIVPVQLRTLGSQQTAQGGAIVALPMADVEATIATIAVWFLLFAAGLLLALGVLGYFGVGRAFRPLHEVEEVATAFGGGDTSRRVAVTAPGTEVGRLGSSVNGMLDSIESTLAARQASEARMRRFVGDASHELRTPLAAVRGFAELYRMGAVSGPEDVRNTFRRIEDESNRMSGLVEDLLLLARMDEQRPLNLTSVDLLVLVDDAAHDATALAPDRVVRVTGIDGRVEPGSALITGDESRVRQVVTNLMANAIRHTPAGTPVELGVGTRDDRAVLQVIDHGAGVAPELAERIFERFFRADASRSRGAGGGSGLGLAIVAALVDAHGGTARVRPTSGGGATFEVDLPSRQPRTAALIPDRSPSGNSQVQPRQTSVRHG